MYHLLSACLLLLSGTPLPARELGLPAAAAARNPYNSEFIAVRNALDNASPPQQAVLLARAYKLRELVDRSSDVEDWLATVVANNAVHPLVRDEAYRYLALIDVNHGQLKAAELKLISLGFVRDWSIVGPFNAASGLDPSLGPGRGFDPSQTFRDASGRQRAWKSLGSPGPRPWIDLADFYSFSGEAVAYAATSVYSDAQSTVALRLGSDSGVAVFVNGAKVFANREDTPAAFDQHAVPVQLQAGWNEILLKLDRRSDGPWRFALRITRPEGGGIALRTSMRESQRDNRATVTSTSQTIDDLVTMAEASIASEPKSAEELETLGLIEREHGRGTNLEHLEAAALRAPSPDFWLEVAEACEETACTFRALNAALRLDPRSAKALLALADYYLGRNQMDKARDLLRQAVALEPGDFVPRSHLADLLVSAGENDTAVQQTRALQRDYPGPLWLKSQTAARYTTLGLFDQALAVLGPSLRESFDSAHDRALLIHIYERRHDAAGLERALRDMIALDPNDVNAMAQLAELRFASGDLAEADRMMLSAVNINPENDQLHQRYANLLSRAGRTDAAAAQLARALEFNPHLQSTQLYLGMAPGLEQKDAEQQYLEDPVRLAARADCTSAAASVNAVALSDVRVEHMYDNGLSSVRNQQVFCVTNPQGAREYGVRSVQYAPSTQQLRILHARVFKRDGRVLDAVDQSESAVADAGVSMYYDVRSHELRYPGLEPGDVIELDYRVSPTINVNPYGDYFASLVVFRSSVPQQLKRYVLIAPPGRDLNVVEQRMNAPAVKTVTVAGQVYRWEIRDAASLPNEPHGPSITEIAPYVHVSTFHSWDEIGRWYAQMIRPQFALDASLRDTAALLAGGKKSEVEKINAVHQFVLRNTHYVAMEFGVYSYKPYPVNQTFVRRFGDCKDKASLMIALLRQAGIDASIALVRTRRLGDIDPKATSIALFNHAIVYVPKWDLWLDGTAEYAGSRELPLEDQGAMALVVALDGSSSLRRIPLTQAQDNFTRRSVHAQLLPNGAIRFSGVAYTRGEDAPGLRREYEVAERQRESFRNSLAELFPSVRLEDVRVDGANDLERDINVEFRGTIDTFSGRSVVPLATSWMPRSYVQTLASVLSRSEDLVLPAPWITEEELHFQLSTGAVVLGLPSDSSIDSPFGSVRIHYGRQGREIVVTTSVQFRQLRISADQYSAFRDFCRQVELAFRQEIKVMPRG